MPAMTFSAATAKAPELCMIPTDFKGPLTIKGSLPGGEQWMCQEKMDGIRALYIKGVLITREGSRLRCGEHLLEPLREIEARLGGDFVLDGEYHVPGMGFHAALSDFRRGEGSGVISLFDAVPLDDWHEDCGAQGMAERYKALLQAMPGGPSNIHLVPATPVTDMIEVMSLCHTIWARGGEGVVLKRMGSPYTRRQSADWLRIKQVFTQDVAILKVEGLGGRLKAIHAETQDGRPLRLGHGWTPEEAAIILSHGPGLIAEIKYQLTTGPNPAIRGAAFVRLRDDKGVSK